MHIHYFQHDHFEDLGFIGDWANEKGITTSVSMMDLKPEFPDLDSFDWLVVMGGKMGVGDAGNIPWLSTEIDYIKDAIDTGKVVLGICLGSQLIAKALGGHVYRNSEPEMGFWPVFFNENSQKDDVFRHFPSQLKVMHMHFDVFDLPDGCIPMANSTVTLCQAFRFKDNVYALQFHFEVSAKSVSSFIKEITPELVPGKNVQTVDELLDNSDCCVLNNDYFSKMLDAILHASSKQ